MKFVSTLAVLLGIFGSASAAIAPTTITTLPAPSTLTTTTKINNLVSLRQPSPLPPTGPTIVNGVKDANLQQVCLARIIEMGLLKLPQLTNVPNPVGFKSLKSQVTSGTTYIANYQGPNYKAKIAGRCEPGTGKAILDEASYQKL